MKRSYIFAGALALAAAAWVASGSLGDGKSVPEAQKAPADLRADAALPSVRVESLTAKPHMITLLVNGHTAAVRSVDLKAEVRGPIAELPVTKGSKVAAGDVVARIEELDRRAALAEARALMTQRRIEYNAALKLSEQGYRAQTQVAGAKAAFEAADAAVRRAEIAVAQLEVKAPFEGVLDQRHVELGAYLDVGDPVVRIVDLDPLLVVAQVSEREIGAIEVGQKGRARLFGGAEVEGRLRFVASAADQATRTFRVELEVPNPEGQLPDGATAELALPLGEAPAHYLSPAVLSLGQEGRIGVKTVDAENRVRFLPVRILSQDPQGVWVEGLPDHVRLITVGQDFVSEGQEVRPDEKLVTKAEGQDS